MVGVGLGEKILVGLDRAPDKAAGAEDRDPGRHPAKSLDQFTTTHAGHGQVRNHQVEPRGCVREKFQRALPVGRRPDLVARGGQNHLRQRQHHFVVIDDQQSLIAPQVFDAGRTVFEDFFLGRQKDPHGGALVGQAAHRHGPAVVGDDPIHPGQPQTPVLRTGLGGKERFKHVRQHVERNAAPIVRDLDADITAGGNLDRAAFYRRVKVPVVGVDGDASVPADRFDRIFQNLDESPLHFRFVQSDRIRLFLQLNGPQNVRKVGPLEHVHGAADQVV